jgi:hypothetical protein
MPGDYYQNSDEDVTPQLQQLLERAATAEVAAFPSIAQGQLSESGSDYQNEDSSAPSSFYFGDDVDVQLNAFDRPFEPVRQDRAIRSFLNRTMPVGARSQGSPLGWQRRNPQAKESSISPVYSLEKEDKRHRMGSLLADFMRIHETKGFGQPFFAWLDGLSYFEVVSILKHELHKSDTFVREFATPFMKGVTYLNEAARKSYRVKIDKSNGKLQWRGQKLDTEAAKLQTVFSGLGWGIWVLSPQEKFYSGPHLRGEFHHSSFLSGEPVKAAGEWKVRDGTIEVINGKTGHYMCDCNALVHALRVLTGKGVSLAKTKVVVWEASGERKPREVPALAFMIDQSIQQEYIAYGSKPMVKPVRPQPKGSFIGAHRTKV